MEGTLNPNGPREHSQEASRRSWPIKSRDRNANRLKPKASHRLRRTKNTLQASFENREAYR